ncbi:MAG: sigma-54 dependent transcriptional regulator [Burkholderiaceae bacterium]|nr:sigma-54 dependent transcriptional regulator [Sulfuritalea sp.]MCF8175570.1 sigma-54 dependent transcriptional regulator [Burkholderiaceae bacterium]MCF8184699.1 sigma-54 dependent transcriptional regulator [Polynucleobacter sp.]
MKHAILIVEDDETLRLTVGAFLRRQGFDIDEAATGEQGLGLAHERRHGLVLLDLRLPDIHGLDVIARLQEIDNDALVVTMTAYPEVRTAVAALKAGAYDYINKPFDLEDLASLIARALETRQLRHEVEWRRAQSDVCGIEGLIGDSPAFQNLVAITHKIAASHLPVLIRGESGSGKERVARAVHCQSARAAGPWVTLNCSALAEGLIESELFGHEKGAFTDAKQQRRGLFELADGGTLFLDEIGDLSLNLQPKLLRVLETQRFRRVGGSREIQVDLRIVAATHRNLPEMVKAGSFREDLYYRLNVGAIDVPSLHERRGDILPLARHFLQDAARTTGIPVPELPATIERSLIEHAWPGNVRELRNVMERAVILCENGVIAAAQLPPEISRAVAPAPTFAPTDLGEVLSLAAIELDHIQRVLALCAGNKTRAAELLGITRLTLRNKLKDTDHDGDHEGETESDAA